jgi:dTDP-4-amino-4,6-dideoxygalactose transaminase
MGEPRFVVGRPMLPPLEEYVELLRELWRTRCLTNAGAFHERLERELAEELGVPHVTLFANGTSALVAALRVAIPDARPGDEVVTTPYTFVATTQAVLALGLRPVFADIVPGTPNLDPVAAARCVTSRTRAILPVHSYGVAADTAALERLSADRGVPLVYDAAHTFGARHAGRSLAAHGRMSVLSLHATKLFHTAEGGAVISHSDADREALTRWRNFGYVDEEIIPDLGTNAKLDELSAALGVALLPHLDEELRVRRRLARRYSERLSTLPGIEVLAPVESDDHNNAYFPVVVGDDAPVSRDGLLARLRERGIVARRYFFPLVTDFAFARAAGLGGVFPHAARLSERVLCLPLHGMLSEDDVDEIVSAVLEMWEAPSRAG